MPLLPPSHRDALVSVAQMLRDARDPWWVIAGAAVALHAQVPVAIDDIDVLVGVADIPLVARLPGIDIRPADGSTLFRSRFYAGLAVCGVTIEFMAGFECCRAGGWQAVLPKSRTFVAVDDVAVPVPDRNELIAMFAWFGRPKDIARIALLQT